MVAAERCPACQIDGHKTANTNRERGKFYEFQGSWGLDPEEIEKAKQRYEVADDSPSELGVKRPSEDVTSDDWTEIPSGAEAQIYESRRMFCLWRSEA